jgi:hypothetical protein
MADGFEARVERQAARESAQMAQRRAPGASATTGRRLQELDPPFGGMPERGTAQAVAYELGLEPSDGSRTQSRGVHASGWQPISEQNLTSCEE